MSNRKSKDEDYLASDSSKYENEPARSKSSPLNNMSMILIPGTILAFFVVISLLYIQLQRFRIEQDQYIVQKEKLMIELDQLKSNRLQTSKRTAKCDNTRVSAWVVNWNYEIEGDPDNNSEQSKPPEAAPFTLKKISNTELCSIGELVDASPDKDKYIVKDKNLVIACSCPSL